MALQSSNIGYAPQNIAPNSSGFATINRLMNVPNALSPAIQTGYPSFPLPSSGLGQPEQPISAIGQQEPTDPVIQQEMQNFIQSATQLANSPLAAQEILNLLEQYPNLKVFLGNQVGLSPSVISQMVTNSGVEKFLSSLADSSMGQNIVSLSTDGGTIDVPPTISSEAKSVVINLSPDKQVVFTGDRAGLAARIFADTFNNSPLFKQNFLNNLEKPESLTNDGIKRYNVFTSENAESAGMQSGDNPSSHWQTMPPSNQPLEGSFIKTFVHEFTHNLAPDAPEEGEQADQILDASGAASGEVCTECGEVHDREHSAFLGGVMNELKGVEESMANKVGYEFNANTSDYSNDLSLLGDFNDGYINGAEVRNNDIQASNTDQVQSFQLPDGSNLSSTFETLKNSVFQQGNFDAALEIINNIPAGLTVDHTTYNPQKNSTVDVERVQSYNVRELIIQELLLEADSNNYFATQDDDDSEKTKLGEFFNHITVNAADQDYAKSIEAAREYLHMDFTAEGINYNGVLTSEQNTGTQEIDTLNAPKNLQQIPATI